MSKCSKTITNPAPCLARRHRPAADSRLDVALPPSALLERLGLHFNAVAPGVDETALPGERPRETALRLAEAKARSVAVAHPDALIIGSDQVADCEGQPIGKPGNHEAAVAMLIALAGKNVVFHTGLALLDAKSGRCATAMVDVRSTFRRLSAAEIGRYRARAAVRLRGCREIRGFGIALFESIASDDPTALIGLR